MGSKRATTAEFIAKAMAMHQGLYSYHNTHYTTAITPVSIHCPVHGQFEQTPNVHLSGRGCKRCGYMRLKQARTKGFSHFINNAISKHHGRYRYDEVSYRGINHPTTIICPKHGPFKQFPANHLKGHGCAKCGFSLTASKKLKGLAYFLEQARQVHGLTYGYEKVILQKFTEHVIITCPKHGDFQKKPHVHLMGQGCQECSARIRRAASRSGWLEVQKGRKAMLYVIEVSSANELFYKVGITFDLTRRYYSTRMPYTWRIVATYESDDAGAVFDLEKHIHRKLLSLKLQYRPQIAFGGHKECYSLVKPILALLPSKAEVCKKFQAVVPLSVSVSPRPLQLDLMAQLYPELSLKLDSINASIYIIEGI